ncbi:TPA: hypothetical protein ACH3X2_004283 [Trebouxia sp. C0005]
MSLQMRQRCTVVTDRGALCAAVATADASSAGLIMHETQLEHVLCVPLSAGHLLIRPNLNASFCALVERCKTRSLLSRTSAHLQDLAMQS